METKVVFHLDEDSGARLTLALNNIENLYKEIPPGQTDVRLVANGTAVRLFVGGQAEAERISRLSAAGAHFLLCRNSLGGLSIPRESLLAPCEIVPAGILELVRLQQEGFAYVKP
jgi:intracellular sulfur oxidation DsrE/DsrF family protein